MASINWEKRLIIGDSGKHYQIAPESLSSARYVEFELRAMTQAYKTNIDGIISVFNDIEKQLTMGPLNAVGNAHEALVVLQNFRSNLINTSLFKRTESIEFCALFCNAEGEDLSVYDEALVAAKWEDWKSIPNEDFFLLSMRVKILLSNRYKDILQQAKKEMGVTEAAEH